MKKREQNEGANEDNMRQFKKDLAKFAQEEAERSKMRYQVLVDMSKPKDERYKIKYLLQSEVDDMKRDGTFEMDGSHVSCGLFDTEEEVEAMITKLEQDLAAGQSSIQ